MKFKIGDKVRVIPAKTDAEIERRCEPGVIYYQKSMNDTAPFIIDRIYKFIGGKTTNWVFKEGWLEFYKPKEPLTYGRCLEILRNKNV